MIKVKDCRYGPMMYNDLDEWIGRSYDYYGEYSEIETKFLTDCVSEGDVVIDVGANIGSMTVPLAKKVGPRGMVVALEPQQFVFNMLCGNIALNELYNAIPFNRIVASTKDEVRLVPCVDYNARGNYGSVSLVDQKKLKNFGLEGKAYPVSTLTIDDLMLAKVNLIKIDVEGMEAEVLGGAVKTIQRYRPFLYVESHKNFDELVKFIKGLDYDFDFHTTPMFNEGNYAKNENNVLLLDDPELRVVSGNIFCWHKQDCDRAKKVMDIAPHCFENLSRSVGATHLSHRLRIKNNDYQTYLTGHGIDIGGGHSSLGKHVENEVDFWDYEDGDAQFMKGIPDKKYDFVYSSHCLEHLKDVKEGLQNWCRIIKPEGYLFVTIPDWQLYEKCLWPSKFNPDHKASFSTTVSREEVGRANHFNIDDIKQILDQCGVDLVETRIEDEGYDHNLPTHFDQTKYRAALAQVCFVGKKRN